MKKFTPEQSEIEWLSFDVLKKILIDPWRVIVVEPLTGRLFISTYGGDEYEIIKQIDVDNNTYNMLSELADEGVIYFDSFGQVDIEIINPHFFDIWRGEVYGKQPNHTVSKSIELGLAESLNVEIN
jgi:hypothetical protein